ncbi:MAG TPA: hypothetical protein PK177_16780, partial [Burkholderiaceae bacterium]|nr:hypothetical protein [Burkholderiaceae bacterium]
MRRDPTFVPPAIPSARRLVLSLGAPLALAVAISLALAAAPAAAQGTPGSPTPGSADAVSPDRQPAEFAACLARLRPEAAAKGVSRATFDPHTASLMPDMGVIASLDA